MLFSTRKLSGDSLLNSVTHDVIDDVLWDWLICGVDDGRINIVSRQNQALFPKSIPNFLSYGGSW